MRLNPLSVAMIMPAMMLMPTLVFVSPVVAEIIGTNIPSLPHDKERIAKLKPTERAAWEEYLEKSQKFMAADKAALQAERVGLNIIPAPISEGHNGETMPLKNNPEYYASPAARHIADVIISFQTPSGGWGKNTGRDGDIRQRGQSYVSGGPTKLIPKLKNGELDTENPEGWNYVGTIDNDATTTEIRFLVLVAASLNGVDGDKYRNAAIKGIEYLLNAQFPNGGFPQIWPLQGGYHDAITYNDNAIIQVVSLLDMATTGKNGFDFIDNKLRQRANLAVEKSIDCILKTQVVINGKLTIWGQQHDAIDLQPTSARNFEMPSLSSAESATILSYLMKIKKPSPDVKIAINSGVEWLRDNALRDVVFVKDDDDKILKSQIGAPLLWPRYYDLKYTKPVFGDRDKSIHDDVSSISKERRIGYSWYVTSPQKALDDYEKWKLKNQ